MKIKIHSITSILILSLLFSASQLLSRQVTRTEKGKAIVSIRIEGTDEQIVEQLKLSGLEEEDILFIPGRLMAHPLYIFLNTFGSIALLIFAHNWLSKKLSGKSKRKEEDKASIPQSKNFEKEGGGLFPDAKY